MWMNPENIILSEIRQNPQVTYCVTPLIQCIQNSYRLVVARSWVRRGEKGCFVDTEFILSDENVWDQPEVVAAHLCECTNCQSVVHF